MTTEEEQQVIGRMVMERQALRKREAALVDEAARASKEFQSLSGLLANYKGSYNFPLKLSPGAEEFLNSGKLTDLVTELLAVRNEIRDLQARLKQAGVD